MKHFENLFVLGRPACGKSEFLDFMRNKISNDERWRVYHIGDMKVIDDFVWLWEKFEDDDIWEKVSGKRFHSTRDGHLYNQNSASMFDFLTERLADEVKKYFEDKKFYEHGTLLIEFSRGIKSPYRDALNRFDPEVLKKAAILYMEVDGAESWRRNEARYQEKLKHSILAHKVPRQTFDAFYTDDDWEALTQSKRSGELQLRGVSVPFVTMNNCPESTDPNVLAPRYGNALSRLMDLVKNR